MDALRQILRAAHWGMSLAVVSGCGGSSSSDGSGGDGGVAGTGGNATGGTDAGSGGSGGSGGSTGGTGGSVHLEPYPTENLGCSGPFEDGGYFGQCCVKVGCFDPEGGAECPAAENANYSIPGFPPGSGSCTCGAPTAGPYAPHEASEGACCYVFGSIGCEGRPLTVGSGEMRVAPVVRRSDWA